MSDKNIPYWRDVHTIVFDFDGVFTDNRVWVDQNGIESIRCDRSDGLGFDLLRAFIQKNNWELQYFILSKEMNPVVSARAQKIQVDCMQSISDLAFFLKQYLTNNNLDSDGLIYLGNDLNDLAAMQISGFSIAPADSHPLILNQANLILPRKGGDGFVREFIEMLIGLERMSATEITNLL